MKTLKLGRTNLEVSRIGIGGIPILRIPEKEAIQVIQYALDLGVTFIDTANAYVSTKTPSEELVGKGIAGRRDSVVIATKSSSRNKKTAAEHIDLSLKRLDTDYIDIWQFHSVSKFTEYKTIIGKNGAMKAAQEALESGKIRHIGFTSHVLEVALKLVATDLFESVQFPFNFVNNDAAKELIPLAKKMNVGFIAMKPFAGGNLKDANLAIKYLLQFDNVLPDPGVKTFQEIKEIVDIVNGSWELKDTDYSKMDEIRDELGTGFCRWCEYCMPCPQKVVISWLMNIKLVESYGDRYYNNTAKAVKTYKNCIQCGECEEKCPYSLSIVETIADNVEYFKGLGKYSLHSSGLK
ncbi:MAG: aldo/keto reductase [Candidatus Thorarchaeota archaeon]